MYLETLEQYVKDFSFEMEKRFTEKRLKHGSAWKIRPVEQNEEYEHQNVRFYNWLKLKMDAWKSGGEAINWIDVANEAMICWVREEELKHNES
jgi:hypothetical protein